MPLPTSHVFIVPSSPTSGHRTLKLVGLAAEAALDGIYVLRTTVPADQLDAAGIITSYKNLAHIERDFRIIKVDDLNLRPIHHRLDDRVRVHVLICLLACYLIWHLRKAWAPMTFTDERATHPRQPRRPRPALPPGAEAKASTGHDAAGNPLRSFRGLLAHLATLTRNQIRFTRHRHRDPHARRPHRRPAPRLHPHRHPHPAHRRVATTNTTENNESPAQRTVEQLPEACLDAGAQMLRATQALVLADEGEARGVIRVHDDLTVRTVEAEELAHCSYW